MFKSLAKAIVGTVLLPVDVVAGVATLGGATTDRRSTYIGGRVKQIAQNLKDAT